MQPDDGRKRSDRGLLVAEMDLDNPERKGILRMRPSRRPVPRELVPRTDQVLVLRTDTGLSQLGWGQKPSAEDLEWLAAQGATLLRRSCREQLSLGAPSSSPDLSFSVVVEWNCTLTNVIAFLDAGDQVSHYHDSVEWIVRETAKDFDPRRHADLEARLSARLKAEMRVKRNEVPGMTVKFARVVVHPPAEALDDHRKRRGVTWQEEQDRLDFEVKTEQRVRAGQRQDEDAESDYNRMEAEAAAEYRRSQLGHKRQLSEVGWTGEEEVAQARSDVKAAAIRHESEMTRAAAEIDLLKAQTKVYEELLAGNNGAAAVGMAKGELSAETVYTVGVDENRWSQVRFYELLRWLIRNDNTGSIDLGEAGRQLVMKEIAELRGPGRNSARDDVASLDAPEVTPAGERRRYDALEADIVNNDSDSEGDGDDRANGADGNGGHGTDHDDGTDDEDR